MIGIILTVLFIIVSPLSKIFSQDNAQIVKYDRLKGHKTCKLTRWYFIAQKVVGNIETFIVSHLCHSNRNAYQYKALLKKMQKCWFGWLAEICLFGKSLGMLGWLITLIWPPISDPTFGENNHQTWMDIDFSQTTMTKCPSGDNAIQATKHHKV